MVTCHLKYIIDPFQLALFSFNSLAEYENYRELSFTDKECQEMFKLANDTKCILSYKRTFLKPIFK